MVFLAVIFMIASSGSTPAQTPVITCTTGALPQGDKMNPSDLVSYTGTCVVDAMQNGQPNPNYYFRNVNIFGGGALSFKDLTVDFWARHILVQNNGSLLADRRMTPIAVKLLLPVSRSNDWRKSPL